MAENVFELLNERYASLTRSEKKLADYIFANRDDLQFISISTMAEHCGVADATVFRFCKALGFGGYNEFKLALAISLTASPSPVEVSGTVYGKVQQGDSFADMCKKLYSTQISALSQTLELADEQAFRKAAEYMHAAKRVYCFGQGSSLVMAMAAWSRFVSVSSHFFFVEDVHLQTMAVSLLGPEDTILFFSYSGATKDMQDLFQLAREKQARIILVTRYQKSPGASMADVVLLCGANEGPLQVGSVSAKMAQLMIVDILFNEYWRLDPALCQKNTETTADAIARKLL